MAAPSASGSVPIVARAARFLDRTAVRDARGSHSYERLLAASAGAARRLLDGAADLAGRRVAFLVRPSFEWVATEWGIWRAGGIAVPLCLAHPPPELDYAIADSGADTLVAEADLHERLAPIATERRLRLLSTDQLIAGPETLATESATRSLAPENSLAPDAAGGEDLAPGAADIRLGLDAAVLPRVEAERGALIIYTSGTTGRPKGVLTTHANIAAQIESLAEAWAWTEDDSVLLVLPLHHVHGVVNVVGCALWSGARCDTLPAFDADEVWRRFAAGDLTLFMAVPTIYSKLIAAWEDQPEDRRREFSEACRSFRLMVSGSAALPVPTLEHWREISGHVLLERYGMTEIGMALSNPLAGERRPGTVGGPLPGVELRRLDENRRPAADDAPAELQVRGPGVFREYWGRPEATAEAFDDGWFKTGDVAVIEDGYYRLLGRQSVDILKTGGYKVSALEVEETLRRHPAIAECAVVGVPDEEWGQRVAAAVELCDGATLELADLRAWAKERIAAYKVPTRLEVVDELPRNALGKVTKAAVVELFER